MRHQIAQTGWILFLVALSIAKHICICDFQQCLSNPNNTKLKMRTKLLFTACALALAISGCKQTCYECEKYEYCARATVVCGGFSDVHLYCAETEAERQQFINDWQTNPQCTSVTYTTTDELQAGEQVEICDSKSEAEDAASDLEITGYQCVKE